jgi:hypothetical protein
MKKKKGTQSCTENDRATQRKEIKEDQLDFVGLPHLREAAAKIFVKNRSFVSQLLRKQRLFIAPSRRLRQHPLKSERAIPIFILIGVQPLMAFALQNPRHLWDTFTIFSPPFPPSPQVIHRVIHNET